MNFKELKPAMVLLVKFFGTYLALTVLYSLYLRDFSEIPQQADPFTMWVADSTQKAMHFLGYEAHIKQFAQETFIRFYLGTENTSLINEGCNAIAIMIIYVSFIVAFSQGLRATLLYTLGGVVILHLVNIVRIALLNYVFLNYPQWSTQAHDILFPVIIYGMVVVLWIIWIVFFVTKKERK